MTGLSLLGSTGSIGEQTLEVAAAHPDRFRVVALTANRNVEKLAAQAERVHPALVVVGSEEDAAALRAKLPRGTRVAHGLEGLLEAVSLAEVQTVVSAIVGGVGLLPTLFAIKNGKSVAIANKETLVMAGNLVTAAAKEAGVALLPVDSEHSAVWQCLGCPPVDGSPARNVRKIWLTASGGPFRGRKKDELRRVTPDDALRHPVWKMGKKITIDSATLMNKGLEVIEARWLFGVPLDDIEVVIHPQGTVHSLVEFVDGSVLAQLGAPDMRLPIQTALTFPDRVPGPAKQLDVGAMGTLAFEKPDLDAFPCLGLAYQAARTGGTAPTILNASNEIAVQLFLEKKISFLDIPQVIESSLQRHDAIADPSLEQILDADRWARNQAYEVAGVRQGV